MNIFIKFVLLLSIICSINAQQYSKFTFRYAPNNFSGCDSTKTFDITNNCSYIKCNDNSNQELMGIRYENGEYHAVFYNSAQTQCVIPATLSNAYDEVFFDCLPNGGEIAIGQVFIFTCGN